MCLSLTFWKSPSGAKKILKHQKPTSGNSLHSTVVFRAPEKTNPLLLFCRAYYLQPLQQKQVHPASISKEARPGDCTTDCVTKPDQPCCKADNLTYEERLKIFTETFTEVVKI